MTTPVHTATNSDRLSLPQRSTGRELSADELDTLLLVADQLIPGRDEDPSASEAPGYLGLLKRALAARADAIEMMGALLQKLEELKQPLLAERLAQLHQRDDDAFHALSSVIVGAYVMVPKVKESIGYPGQHRNPARTEQAVEDLEDGLLDPVIERGPCYVSAVGE